jgi:hypothetical protein
MGCGSSEEETPAMIPHIMTDDGTAVITFWWGIVLFYCCKMAKTPSGSSSQPFLLFWCSWVPVCGVWCVAAQFLFNQKVVVLRHSVLVPDLTAPKP